MQCGSDEEEQYSLESISPDQIGKSYQTQPHKNSKELPAFNFASQQPKKELDEFSKVLDGLRNLENNFSKIKCRKLIT
jgi:hypothetical protein